MMLLTSLRSQNPASVFGVWQKLGKSFQMLSKASNLTPFHQRSFPTGLLITVVTLWPGNKDLVLSFFHYYTGSLTLLSQGGSLLSLRLPLGTIPSPRMEHSERQLQ